MEAPQWLAGKEKIGIRADAEAFEGRQLWAGTAVQVAMASLAPASALISCKGGESA